MANSQQLVTTEVLEALTPEQEAGLALQKAMEVLTLAKVTGSASTTYIVWDFEITDAGVIPDEYIIIDRAKIARAVKELKEECNIPGVRAFSRIEVK